MIAFWFGSGAPTIPELKAKSTVLRKTVALGQFATREARKYKEKEFYSFDIIMLGFRDSNSGGIESFPNSYL